MPALQVVYPLIHLPGPNATFVKQHLSGLNQKADADAERESLLGKDRVRGGIHLRARWLEETVWNSWGN